MAIAYTCLVPDSRSAERPKPPLRIKIGEDIVRINSTYETVSPVVKKHGFEIIDLCPVPNGGCWLTYYNKLQKPNGYKLFFDNSDVLVHIQIGCSFP